MYRPEYLLWPSASRKTRPLITVASLTLGTSLDILPPKTKSNLQRPGEGTEELSLAWNTSCFGCQIRDSCDVIGVVTNRWGAFNFSTQQEHFSGIIKLSIVMTTWSLNILILSTFYLYDQIQMYVSVVDVVKVKHCIQGFHRNRMFGICLDWRQWPDWFDLTGWYGNQISRFTTVMIRKASQNIWHMKPWGWRTIETEDHVSFHACQPRTGIC